MRPLFVVTLEPFRTDLSDLVQRFKHVGVQYFCSIRAIESFDEGILIGLARLDVPQFNSALRTPGHELFGDQLRAIVEANRLGPAPPAHHLRQHADHVLSRKRRINLDGQALSHAFIQNIEGAESSPAVQRIAHEIHSPHGIGLWDDRKRLSHSNRQPLLRPSRQVQPQLAIDSPEPLGIPRMAIEPEPITTLPEAPATLGRHECRERCDHRRIALGLVYERPVVRGPAHPHRATGPLHRKAVYRHQVRDDFPPFSRP